MPEYDPLDHQGQTPPEEETQNDDWQEMDIVDLVAALEDDPDFDNLKSPCDMCGKEYVGASYLDNGHTHCAECHTIWNS